MGTLSPGTHDTDPGGGRTAEGRWTRALAASTPHAAAGSVSRLASRLRTAADLAGWRNWSIPTREGRPVNCPVCKSAALAPTVETEPRMLECTFCGGKYLPF